MAHAEDSLGAPRLHSLPEIPINVAAISPGGHRLGRCSLLSEPLTAGGAHGPDRFSVAYIVIQLALFALLPLRTTFRGFSS